MSPFTATENGTANRKILDLLLTASGSEMCWLRLEVDGKEKKLAVCGTVCIDTGAADRLREHSG